MSTVQATDPFGNPIHVQRPESVAAVAGFIEGFLAYEPCILDVLAAAEHDDSLIIQACAAALWMFSESPAGPPRAREHLARARAGAAAGLPASERERLFAGAVSAWVGGDLASALMLHAQLAHEHPRDLAALKLGQYHAFNLGDSATMLRLALQARPAASDVAWFHGMLAFAHEQCHHLHAAEDSARRALALRTAEPWAEHAIAHVMLTDGRFAEGRDFLARASAPWQGLTSFMRTHNWWHLALFHLELGDDAAALALYDREVWGVDKTYTQDQIGAVSLLARLELAEVDVGERWQDVADHLASRVHDQVQPFLDLQYLYGLARAGRPEARALQQAITDFAPRAPEAGRVAWQQVTVPAAQGLLAHAQGRWAEAAEALTTALPRLLRIGGSHAQRDLFEQIWLDALLRAGDAGAVLNALQPRMNAAPQSRRLARRLGRVHAVLGLPVAG